MATTATPIDTAIGTFTLEQDQTASGKPAPRWRITDSEGNQTAEVFPTKKAAAEALAAHVKTVQTEGDAPVQPLASESGAIDEAPEPVVEDAPVEAPAKTKSTRTPKDERKPSGELIGFSKEGRSVRFAIDAKGVVFIEDGKGDALTYSFRRVAPSRDRIVKNIEEGKAGYLPRVIGKAAKK
jgi:hypothetical protein